MKYNNVHIEGDIVDCRMGYTLLGRKPYADMLVLTTKKFGADNRYLSHSYNRVRVPVTEDIRNKINSLVEYCDEKKRRRETDFTYIPTVKERISCNGMLVNDSGKAFVLVNDRKISFPEQVSGINRFEGTGQIDRIIDCSQASAAASVLVKVPCNHGTTDLIVKIDAQRHPSICSDIASGKIAKGDRLTIAGDFDNSHKMYVFADTMSVVKRQKICKAAEKKHASLKMSK